MANITKRTVDALKPGASDTFLWDESMPGFGVRCRPSGAKIYFLKYRTRSGRQRWLTLGRHGELTAVQARERAERERLAARDGGDPSGEIQRKRKENSISDLADRYLREHVEVHNKPSSAKEIRRLVEKVIKPGLGRYKITELTRADIKAWHQSLNTTSTMANRALAACSKMLALACKDWGLRPDNPCLGLKRFPEHKRERFFTDEELARLGRALAAVERDKTEPAGFVILVKVLATTGMRLSEVLNLRWADVDLPARSIRLLDAKAGARTVYLGAAAVSIFDAVESKEGYVVQKDAGGDLLSVDAAEKAWVRLRVHAKIEDGRLHDLRHTAGTFAALAGANAFAVRDLLGHKTLAMTGRYVERAADMVRATADAVSNRVLAALEADERKPAQVVNFSAQR